MSGWVKVVLGALIGLAVGSAGVVLMLLVLLSALPDATGKQVFAGVVLVPMLLPVPLLLFRQTRMWAVGLVIGAGLASIGLAGSCVLIIQLFSGAAA